MKTKSKFLRILSLVSALAVLTTCNALFPSASADETADSAVWDGSVATSFEGEGTPDSPYLIKDGADLKLLLKECNRQYDIDLFATNNVAGHTYNNYYKLTNDIYLNDVSDPEWYNKTTELNVWDCNEFYNTTYSKKGPITGYPFLGTLDGDGYAIKGIYYEGTERVVSLFPSVGNGAVVKNLVISDSYIKSTNTAWNAAVSALFAFTDVGYSGTNNYNLLFPKPVQIEKCYVTDSVKLDSANCVGGLVGNANNMVELKNCLSKAVLSINGDSTTVSVKKNSAYKRGAFIGFVEAQPTADSNNKGKYLSPFDKNAKIVSIENSLAANEQGIIPLLPYANTNCELKSVYMIQNPDYWSVTDPDVYDYHIGTMFDTTRDSYVTQLSAYSDIVGDKAKETLEGFDFGTAWQTVQGDTPILLFPKAEIAAHKNAYVKTTTDEGYAKGTLAFGADLQALKAYLNNEGVVGDVEIGFVSSTEYALTGDSELNLEAVGAGKAIKANITADVSALPDNLYCILKAPASHIDSETNTVTGTYLSTVIYTRAYIKYGDNAVIYGGVSSAKAEDILNSFNK